MKNTSLVLWVLLMAFLCFGCGKKESSAPASRPMDPSSLSGEALPMPETAGPADLPPCPGFVSMEAATGDSDAGSSILFSSWSVDALLDSYTPDLLADGWTLGTSFQQGREHHLQFRQGHRFLRFQIGPSDTPAGGSRLHLIWSQAAGTGGVREAYEPAPEEEAPSEASTGSREW